MSARTSKKNLHLQKLKGLMFPIESCKAFVLGLSGGDCAGKREIIQFMFERRGEEWIIRETQEPVAILHQEYFVKESNGKQFMSEGTDW